MALEYCGALVTTAASAEEAKRILENLRPHVLASDIGLPDDGLKLIREVKTVALTKGLHIPAIAITAYRHRREEAFSPLSWYASLAFHRVFWLTHRAFPPSGIWLLLLSHRGATMPDEQYLREKDRKAVENGKLPARAPDRTWGGPGVGGVCAVCEKPVTKAELEFEIQFARDGSNPGLDKFHVHIRCFAMWELERVKAGQP